MAETSRQLNFLIHILQKTQTDINDYRKYRPGPDEFAAALRVKLEQVKVTADETTKTLKATRELFTSVRNEVRFVREQLQFTRRKLYFVRVLYAAPDLPIVAEQNIKKCLDC